MDTDNALKQLAEFIERVDTALGCTDGDDIRASLEGAVQNASKAYCDIRAQLAEARQALSAAKTCIAAKDAAYAIQSRQWNELQEKARTADSEREANAILTDENESLRQQLAETQARLAEIGRQEPVGFTHPNAPGGVQFYKPLPALTKLYADPVSPAAQAVIGNFDAGSEGKEAMSDKTPSIGQHWRWKCDPNTALVYLGKVGVWHQFAKVETPKVVWCEALSEDLRLLEAVQQQKEVK